MEKKTTLEITLNEAQILKIAVYILKKIVNNNFEIEDAIKEELGGITTFEIQCDSLYNNVSKKLTEDFNL